MAKVINIEDARRLQGLSKQAEAEQDGERLVELIEEILLLLPEDPHETIVVLLNNKSAYVAVEKPAKRPVILPDAT